MVGGRRGGGGDGGVEGWNNKSIIVPPSCLCFPSVNEQLN